MMGIALPVGVFYVGVRRAWRQLAAAEAYRDVAHHLGLLVDTRGLSVQGTHHERRLWIGQVMVGYGSERRREVRGVLSFARPLVLGLLVRPHSARSRLRRRSRRLNVGIAALDKRFQFHGDEPDRVHALFAHERVQVALTALVERWPQVLITDHFVRVVLSRPESTPRDLHALVNALEAVAAAIEAARSEVRVPTRLESLAARWEPQARELGLNLDPALPALTGQLAGRDVLITARRGAEGYSLSLQTRLSMATELGFQLKPQVDPDGYWSVGQDIQVAHDVFDAAFVIKGWDPDAIRELLSHALCEDLLALQALGNVQADDDLLSVHDIPVQHEDIAGAAGLLVKAAEQLER